MRDLNQQQKDAPEGFNSLDCIDLVMEGPGDNTIRPVRRSRWAQVKAERDRIYGPSDLQPPEEPQK